MAGRDPDHPGDVRWVHLDLVRDLGEEHCGVTLRGNSQEVDVGDVALAVHGIGRHMGGTSGTDDLR